MNRYDIVFAGNMAVGTIVPFRGSPFVERGCPAFFGPIAASCVKGRIATITRITDDDEGFLGPLKAAGIDLFLRPGEITEMRIVFPTANVDERQVFLIKGSGCFYIQDIPSIEPCLIHLGSVGIQEFPLEFIRALKARGFSVSVDMQSFVLRVGDQANLVHAQDVPEKKEILSVADFVKLDVTEAKALTCTDLPQDQADILEDWGGSEIIITSSQGALVRNNGKTNFTEFTNRNTEGRMGRGDTFMGAYLACRLDHSVDESLPFAAALTSIKMESAGPFKGSIAEVLTRMRSG